MATLFNKVLATSAVPTQWGESIIKLIHKKGTTDDPGNFRPIALSNTVIKTFHLILANRTTTYLTKNKLIDPSIQKAFLPGISGCTEHNAVMEEVIKHIKSKKLTAHIAFFDLADAFGSIPHDLILHTLQRNHFPQAVQEYYKSLYSVTKSKVVTKSFQSDPFFFKKGVTQGDPMSPIIFILTFQPIIDFILKSEDFGVMINGERVITLPYADDFCLITRDMRTQQRFIDQINSHIQSMGMLLKPSKCRSFSIKSGKPTVVPFHIGDHEIPSIAHEEQKILGKVIFFSGKSKETLAYFKDALETKLKHIENTQIRNENKLWIYKHYFLPSIRFLLTIHEITVTDLKQLDMLCNRYIKSWAGVPRGGTNLIFHMSQSMNIQTIQNLYEETHCLNHAAMRIANDPKVNKALDNAIERESKQLRKKSIVVQAQTVYEHALEKNTLDTDIPVPPGDCSGKQKQKTISCIKNTVKETVRTEQAKLNNAHLQGLLKQSEFLKITLHQQQDATWQSYLFNLKKGTMKFILNASINTLSTQDNLKLWNKSTSDKCALCGNRDSTLHTLTGCKVALDQKRYTWRHDNIVKYIADSIDSSKYTVNADVEGYFAATGGTIDPVLAVTLEKPDIVIRDMKKNTVDICELTAGHESNISKNNKYKTNKYSWMLTDITSMSPRLTAFEVGCRGLITPENRFRLKHIHSFCRKDIKLKTFIDNCSALSVNSSYLIFNMRKEPTFPVLGFFGPPFK